MNEERGEKRTYRFLLVRSIQQDAISEKSREIVHAKRHFIFVLFSI